jgi:hypothetical protein
MVPIPVPTLAPTTTTSYPTTSPTSYPTESPTMAPSLNPTPADTVSVYVEFELEASGTPTTADEDDLKVLIANFTDARVQNFQVTYVTARRRHLLTSYTWTVSCDVEAVLANVGATTLSEFTAQVNTQLSSTKFSNKVIATLPTTVSSVTFGSTVANTRNPSSTPTMVPYPMPSLSPTTVPPTAPPHIKKNKTNNTSDASTTPILVSSLCVGGFVLIVLGWRYAKNKSDMGRKKALTKEISMRQSSIRKAKAYSNPDIYMKPRGGSVEMTTGVRSLPSMKNKESFTNPSQTTNDNAFNGNNSVYIYMCVFFLVCSFLHLLDTAQMFECICFKN